MTNCCSFDFIEFDKKYHAFEYLDCLEKNAKSPKLGNIEQIIHPDDPASESLIRKFLEDNGFIAYNFRLNLNWSITKNHSNYERLLEK